MTRLESTLPSIVNFCVVASKNFETLTYYMNKRSQALKFVKVMVVNVVWFVVCGLS